MPANQGFIEAYKSAREDAEEVIGIADTNEHTALVAATLLRFHQEQYDAYRTRYWETIATLAAAKIGKHLADAPADVMTDAQAQAFAATPVPYGKYAGTLVRNMPDDYWHWLHHGPWAVQLRQYLNSPYYQNKTS